MLSAQKDLAVSDWIAVKDQVPPHDEPVVYARPHRSLRGVWSVGIAYWTVSKKWNPEQESQQAPEGFTHYKPLGSQPTVGDERGTK